MAWIVEQVQRPTLLIAHNKTLAAQLCNELREFFPDNAVEYFVSYYDYYQPEAYVPQADLYIEKDSSRNDDIDRLRHAATAALLSRRDVVIVASVSCIYGLGSPEEYDTPLASPGRRCTRPTRRSRRRGGRAARPSPRAGGGRCRRSARSPSRCRGRPAGRTPQAGSSRSTRRSTRRRCRGRTRAARCRAVRPA